jgi:hypothetical protein
MIIFKISEASLAYFIKSQIGYGKVKKNKNKDSINLIVDNLIGINKIIYLINGKIRSQNILTQIEKNILTNINFKNLTFFNLNTENNLNNHWLAGFCDANSSFQINIFNKDNINDIQLNFQKNYINKELLNLIKECFGGNIEHIKNQNVYNYTSTSLFSAKSFIDYFDHFHLLSSNHVNYLKWRKSYIIIQNNEHLSETGFGKILKFKNSMNRNNNTD